MGELRVNVLQDECRECGGCGWVLGTDADCCGGSEYECGGRGCTGPVQIQTQEQCEWCFGTGDENARSGEHQLPRDSDR